MESEIDISPNYWVYFLDWDPLNFVQESCAHGNGSDVIKVKSFKECKKKSEAYRYLWFAEKEEFSGGYKCIRHMTCDDDSFMEAEPGSLYTKLGWFHINFCQIEH